LKTSIALLSLLIYFGAFAAQNDSAIVKDFLFVDVGGSLNSYKDELVSPLRYTGVHSSLRLGYEYRNKRSRWSVQFLATQGNLSSSAPTVQREQIPSAQRYQLNLNYDFKLPKIAFKKWNFTAGVELQTLVVNRENDEFDNASFTFDAATTLGPSITANRTWTKKKRTRSIWFLKWEQKPHKMRWNNRISTSLFGQASRPSYQTIFEYTSERQTLLNLMYNDENIFFGTVDRIFSLSTHSSISWHFFNGNELHLTYNWNYYRLANKTQDGRNTSEGGMNNFGIAFYYALFKK
jgi:hypothetical protein